MMYFNWPCFLNLDRKGQQDKFASNEDTSHPSDGTNTGDLKGDLSKGMANYVSKLHWALLQYWKDGCWEGVRIVHTLDRRHSMHRYIISFILILGYIKLLTMILWILT